MISSMRLRCRSRRKDKVLYLLRRVQEFRLEFGVVVTKEKFGWDRY